MSCRPVLNITFTKSGQYTVNKTVFLEDPWCFWNGKSGREVGIGNKVEDMKPASHHKTNANVSCNWWRMLWNNTSHVLLWRQSLLHGDLRTRTTHPHTVAVSTFLVLCPIYYSRVPKYFIVCCFGSYSVSIWATVEDCKARTAKVKTGLCLWLVS